MMQCFDLNGWYRVTVLEEELGRMSPDLAAIEAYKKKEADYQHKAQELENATTERDEVIFSPSPKATYLFPQSSK